MNHVLSKIGISFGVSVAVNENVSVEPLLTALITLGVSVITVLSVEGVAWLRAWLKNKRAKEESRKKEYEEADEVCEIVEEEHKED